VTPRAFAVAAGLLVLPGLPSGRAAETLKDPRSFADIADPKQRSAALFAEAKAITPPSIRISPAMMRMSGSGA
jgi:hypothetical protein